MGTVSGQRRDLNGGLIDSLAVRGEASLYQQPADQRLLPNGLHTNSVVSLYMLIGMPGRYSTSSCTSGRFS